MAIDYDAVRQEHIKGYGEYTHHLDLLGRLYADPTHFIFELLQNAEDAGATRIKFSLFRGRLEVLNDGRPFSEADVCGICAIGRGTKSDDLTQIGKFGIGFKSVYAHTTSPEVHSGEEHFRIEYYVRPFGEEPRLVPDSWTTLFVLPFLDPPAPSFNQIATRLEHLDTRTLLFLRNLQEIEWSIEAGESGLFIREAEPKGSAKLTRIIGERGASEADEEWLIFRRALPVDLYANQAPISEQKRLYVEIAFLLERSSCAFSPVIKAIRTSPLVVFFPTEKPTGLGFLIQGPYRTTPTRENVPADNEWNRQLVVETAELLAEALHQLREIEMLTVGALETLPLEAANFPKDSMFRPIFDRTRTVLTSERLLPTEDGSFGSASEAKLARGAELRELMTDEQLSKLYGAPSRWLSGEIPQDRTAILRAYFINILKIEEVDPESLARKLDDEFLEHQSDEWTIRFYKFLNGQRALWRTSYSPGLLRRRAIIRLRDGSHVVPFRDGVVPNAYISPAEGTDLPTVKAVLVADEEACAFLRDLGLKEPDPVAEIIERLIPKYIRADSVSEQEHLTNIQKILTTLREVSQERRHQLILALRDCSFLRNLNCCTSITAFKKPSEIYLPNPDTHIYFAGDPNAWLMEEPTIDEKDFDTLKSLGASGEPRHRCQPNTVGHVIVQSWWGNHARGLNGFDPNCDIDGLQHALENITVEIAQYIWNKLLPVHRRHLYGTVQRSSRQNYDPWSTRETQEYSVTGRRVTESAWLPDKSGVFRIPTELSLSDLPEAFNQDDELARALGMSQSLPPGIDKSILLREAGLTPEAIRLVRDDPEFIELLAKRPDAVERMRKELNERPEFPVHCSPDRARRNVGLSQRVEAAPKKTYELRERSTRVSDGALSLAKTYLRDLYTNVADEMICQACHREMPFRLADRSYYFEAVEYCSAVGREIPENRLALCPVCAAKWHHARDESPQELAAAVLSANVAELKVVLAGSQTILRFVETHFLDLKVVLATSLRSQDAQDSCISQAQVSTTSSPVHARPVD
jgi:hypothetical protein